MNTEEILNKIKKGLRGNSKRDIEYLIKQLFKYKAEDKNGDISKKIGVMIYDLLPQEHKPSFAAFLEGGNDRQEAYKEALRLAVDGQYLNSRIIIEKEIKNIIKQSRADNEIISFNSFFELCIYTQVYKKNSSPILASFDYNLLYKLYSFVLFKLGKTDEAVGAIREAVIWNPISASCLTDMAELYKVKNDLKNLARTCERCLKTAYDRHNISRAFRGLGYYYLEKEEFDTAICFYVMSNDFEQNNTTVEELSKIISKTGKKLRKPDSEEIKEVLGSKGISCGANPQIIKLAADIGNLARENNDINLSAEMFNIVFSLTADVDINRNYNEIKLRKRKNKGKNNED